MGVGCFAQDPLLRNPCRCHGSSELQLRALAELVVNVRLEVRVRTNMRASEQSPKDMAIRVIIAEACTRRDKVPHVILITPCSDIIFVYVIHSRFWLASVSNLP